eukprot:gene11869-1424_t
MRRGPRAPAAAYNISSPNGAVADLCLAADGALTALSPCAATSLAQRWDDARGGTLRCGGMCLTAAAQPAAPHRRV